MVKGTYSLSCSDQKLRNHPCFFSFSIPYIQSFLLSLESTAWILQLLRTSIATTQSHCHLSYLDCCHGFLTGLLLLILFHYGQLSTLHLCLLISEEAPSFHGGSSCLPGHRTSLLVPNMPGIVSLQGLWTCLRCSLPWYPCGRIKWGQKPVDI